MINLSLIKSMEEVIQTFTDTPAKVVSQDELTEAEEQIDKEEESVQKDDEQYREEHTSEEVKTSMEYGTPSGSDSSVVPSGCPGCVVSNQDAADAAIIDAGITPVEPTEENKESSETEESGDFSDAEETSEEDTDFETEMKVAVTYLTAYDVISGEPRDLSANEVKAVKAVFGKMNPAMEDLGCSVTGDATLAWETIKIIFNTIKAGMWAGYVLAGRMLKCAWNIATYLYDFLDRHQSEIRNTCMNIFASVDYIAGYWAKQFGKLVEQVSEDELTDIAASSFSYKDWNEKLDKLLEVNKFIVQNKKVFIEDTSKIDGKFKELSKMIDKLGIEFDLASGEANTDKFEERRSPDSIVSLGFTPKNMLLASRHVATLLKIYKKNGDNDSLKLISSLKAILESIRNTTKESQDEKYLKQCFELEIKIYYVTLAIEHTHKLMKELLVDFINIGKEYEKIADSKKDK